MAIRLLCVINMHMNLLVVWVRTQTLQLLIIVYSLHQVSVFSNLQNHKRDAQLVFVHPHYTDSMSSFHYMYIHGENLLFEPHPEPIVSTLKVRSAISVWYSRASQHKLVQTVMTFQGRTSVSGVTALLVW